MRNPSGAVRERKDRWTEGTNGHKGTIKKGGLKRRGEGLEVEKRDEGYERGRVNRKGIWGDGKGGGVPGYE